MSNQEVRRIVPVKRITENVLPIRESNSVSARKQLQWAGMSPVEWIDLLSNQSGVKQSVRKREDQSFPLPSQGNLSRNQMEPQSSTNQGVSVVATGSQNTSLPFPPMLRDDRTVLEKARSLVNAENFPPYQMPEYWDLCIVKRSPVAEPLRLLVLSIEGHSRFEQVRHLYEQLRDEYFHASSEKYANDHHPRYILNQTFHKLIAVLEICQKLDQQEEEIPIYSFSSHDVVPEKQNEFSEYVLTNWIRENWINPYPDETVLRDLASTCGTTTAAISGWITDARERKWRPAIVQAYELKRPAEMLLKDSIRIFNEEHLRTLVDEKTKPPLGPKEVNR